MVTDFALRGVILQDFHARAPEVYDLTFQSGRLTRFVPTPACAGRRLRLTPGFSDAHHHLLHAGLAVGRCDLGSCASLVEALERLADYARGPARDFAILRGERWDESHWPEGRGPTRAELDALAPDRPLVLRRICGHRVLLNTVAAREAASRLGPLGPDGEPTEEQTLLLSSVWPPSPAQLEGALAVAQERAIAMGITRVTEMGAYGALDTYVALARRGALKIDVELYLPPRELERVVALRGGGEFESRRLHLAGIKLYADGSIGARTAALRRPYADRATTGQLLLEDDALHTQLARALDAELTVAVHAIGDAAILQVLAQVERLATRDGRAVAGRVRLEHVEMIDQEMLARAGALGIDLSLQPNFVAQWAGPGGLYETALGRERALAMNPFVSMWDHPGALVFGSDGMPMDPAVGLLGAVAHPAEEQRLTPEQALSLYLGARAVPGGLWRRDDWWQFGCDGAVLYGSDPLELASGDLARAPVLAVLWGGEWLLEPPAELYRSGVIHVL